MFGGTPMSVRGAIAIAVALIAVAINASTAQGASTRSDYIAQVDPICQAALAQEFTVAQQLKRKLHRLKKQADPRKARRRASKREMRAFARFYEFVAVVEQGVNAQVAAIPPATEDTSLIQVWLRVRGEEVVATQGLLRALGKGDRFAAFLRSLEAGGKSEEASDIVRDFGFRYCSGSKAALYWNTPFFL